MPPSAPSMAIFQRGGNYLQHRLTKLYSDTKQSYEKAAITAATSTPSAQSDPDVEALRRDFQIQQDRLLAWGLDWADTNAAENHDPRGDVEIDKKLDKAGLGDVVADVMSKIQGLLDVAASIQRPTKKFRTLNDNKRSSSFLPDKADKRWTWHEITEFRSVLDQLTTCIDVLYKVTESKRTSSQSSKLDSDPVNTSESSLGTQRIPKTPAESHRTSFATAREGVDLPQSDAPAVQNGGGGLGRHSHYIAFESMSFVQGDDSDDSGLPLYEEAMAHERSRVVGTLLDGRHGKNILSSSSLFTATLALLLVAFSC